MGERKSAIIAVLFSLLLLGSMSGVVFASSGNWVEVTEFSGRGLLHGDTNPFTIDYVEWRVRWEINSLVDGTDIGIQQFNFVVEIHGNMSEIIASSPGSGKKNGTLNISGYTGTFHLNFPPHVLNYTILVEQNLESIPEFPSWIILPLFVTATLIGILVRKRLVRT